MMRIGQRVLKRFEILDLIAEGGQACVAKGKDRRTGAYVAIRQLTAARKPGAYETAVARFKREARLAIDHPGLLKTIEYGEENNEWYMVLPFVEGRTLEERVAAAGGRLSARDTTACLIQIAGALGACHAAGVVHRDIKPANILCDNGGAVFLIDLGICSLTREGTLTDGSGLLGTLHWLSPEQIIQLGCRDPRLDLYALGAVLYYCLTGRIPIEGQTPEEIVLSICGRTPPAPSRLEPSVPPELDRICLRLLEKDPSRRFQSATEVCKALSAAEPRFAWSSTYRACGAAGVIWERCCGTCGVSMNGAATGQVRCLACRMSAEGETVCPGCSRRFSASDHRLAFDRGVLAGLAFRVPEGAYIIGRDVLAPKDAQISRRHLCVVCTNGDVFVSDAQSTNKTYVNAQQANRPTRLVPGCRVRIASNEATYVNQKRERK